MTTGRNDRAAGALVGLAAGDALGAPYEFQPPRIHGEPVAMVGGGGFGWAPGEWTDDTSMAIVIARATAEARGDLLSSATLDQMVAQWAQWAGRAPDVGIQTRAVLGAVNDNPTAVAATAAAERLHERTGRTAGNGSLMRTAPVALAYLDDPVALDSAARTISALTHHDTEAGEACAIWCHAIAHAVNHATFDGLRLAVDSLPGDRRVIWRERLDHAESVEPHEIPNNGWVVGALMAAWSAISRTSQSGPQHFGQALEAAVRCGNDTDTVAAIAGSLLGARWGVSAIPLEWQRILHGWPGWRARDLAQHAVFLANGCRGAWPPPNTFDYTRYGELNAHGVHPHDPEVTLGGVGVLRALPDGVDAVVSLCRLGAGEVPAPGIAASDHVEVWLIDSAVPQENQHLDFVLAQAADSVAMLRSEGKRVLVHCVQAHSRTPTVAALYSVRHLGVEKQQAVRDVCDALPDASPNPAFLNAVARLARR